MYFKLSQCGWCNLSFFSFWNWFLTWRTYFLDPSIFFFLIISCSCHSEWFETLVFIVLKVRGTPSFYQYCASPISRWKNLKKKKKKPHTLISGKVLLFPSKMLTLQIDNWPGTKRDLSEFLFKVLNSFFLNSQKPHQLKYLSVFFFALQKSSGYGVVLSKEIYYTTTTPIPVPLPDQITLSLSF